MKAVIFDFDGTIADTLALMVRCLRKQDHDQRYKDITFAEVRKHSVAHLVYRLMREMKLSPLAILSLQKRITTCMAAQHEEITLFPRIKELIGRLREHHYHVAIVTSNGSAFVNAVLQRHKLIVDSVYAGNSLFGKHRRLARVKAQLRLGDGDVLYVGDEIRDIHAARKAQMPIISVTWGFNDEESLEQEHPDMIASDTEDLYRLIRSAFHSTSTDGRRPPRRL